MEESIRIRSCNQLVVELAQLKKKKYIYIYISSSNWITFPWNISGLPPMSNNCLVDFTHHLGLLTNSHPLLFFFFGLNGLNLENPGNKTKKKAEQL